MEVEDEVSAVGDEESIGRVEACASLDISQLKISSRRQTLGL